MGRRGGERGGCVTLTVASLLAAYRSGRSKPSDVAATVAAAAAASDQPVWITLVPEDDLLARARMLDGADRNLPLYGVPFAVKDNIDVAGLPTTAGCPGCARIASEHAPVVAKLLDAGAILVGKTNLDQFATGLVGTRSPYGALSSVCAPDRVSGGSSSGSAVAVAARLVAFALGTDTAGSGRVPAAFNGLVGLKPTRGLISTRRVVPACASLDCVSVLTHTAADAALVLEVVAGYDPGAPWSRAVRPSIRVRRHVVGLPSSGQAEPDETPAAETWFRVRARVRESWDTLPVDIQPLLDAAPLLYDVWVAERAVDLGPIIECEPEGLDPTVASIIRRGAELGAMSVFEGIHRLAELRRQAKAIWHELDALILPTAPLHPTHAQVADDPIRINDRLGRFTNFANLMDLAAVAVPAGERADGLPFGVTLLAPAGEDQRLLELAAEWLGEQAGPRASRDEVELVVAGAHMSGLELNSRLTGRGARLIRRAETAPAYRLYELPGAEPRRPGLVRVTEGGAEIEIEVWALAPEALGHLLTEVPPPQALGRVELADGASLVGLVCEGYVAEAATEITDFGGWKNYVAATPAGNAG
jgi:allophanate hydrolase